MNSRRYIFRFFLNSLLWYLFCYITEIISPDKTNPQGIWDVNMITFILGISIFFGIHLIPFYLISIKNIYNNKLKFFIINIFIIIIFNPLTWIRLYKNISYKFEISKQFLSIVLLTTIIHIIVFIICFFIKQIYFKFNK